MLRVDLKNVNSPSKALRKQLTQASQLHVATEHDKGDEGELPGDEGENPTRPSELNTQLSEAEAAREAAEEARKKRVNSAR